MFGVNDLNGLSDPSTNRFEVEGGLFTEDLVTRYPFIVIKCISLRATIAGEGPPVGPDPKGSFLRTYLNGKFSSLYRKLYREEWKNSVLGPPLPLLHQEGRWDTGPYTPQIYARIKKFLKLNIPSKTITVQIAF